MSDPHVIVVGATGWVGRHLVAQARGRGLAGVAVSRQGHGAGTWPSHPLGDLAMLARRTGAVVVNAAGATRGSPATLREANLELVDHLARICLETGAGLLTLGSAAEYGVPVTPLVAETDPPRPTSPYGESKLAATRSVLGQVEAGLRGTVVRVFNLVGADRCSTDPVSDFASAVNALPPSGGSVYPNDSSLVRDFTGIDRAAEILLDLCEHVGEAPVVNLCNGRGVAFRDLILAMGQVRGVPVAVSDTSPGGISSVVGDPRLLFELVGMSEPETVRELAALALGPAHVPDLTGWSRDREHNPTMIECAEDPPAVE